MGTRHLILVYYKGAWHIAQYGQYDGYPKGQGLDILRFVANPEKVSKLKAVIDTGNMLYKPTQEQLDTWDEERSRLWQYSLRHIQPGVEEFGPSDPLGLGLYPSTCARTGAKILDLVANATEPVAIVKDLLFLTDLLFCEWAYVVDLDEGALEVYTGSVYDAPNLIKTADETRFVEDENFKDVEYLPNLVGKWMFDNLPSELDFQDWFDGTKSRST